MILNANELLLQGLVLAGHPADRQARWVRSTRVDRFVATFGKDPAVLVLVWNRLQTTNNLDAKIIDATEEDLHEYLWALNWLKEYSTEKAMTGRTGWYEKKIRKVVKDMVCRIYALLHEKVFWPPEWDNPLIDTPIFLISVDGVHCPIQEPTSGHKYSKNPKYYSHKFHRSALAYEVAISIFTSKVVWINGPFPAGTTDPDIFSMPNGLRSRMPAGKKCIADSAYNRKEFTMVSLTYYKDTPAVKEFKRRARSRQESFFAKMKVFSVLKDEFRHGDAFHKTVFHAVAVICQFEIELVPLFDA